MIQTPLTVNWCLLIKYCPSLLGIRPVLLVLPESYLIFNGSSPSQTVSKWLNSKPIYFFRRFFHQKLFWHDCLSQKSCCVIKPMFPNFWSTVWAKVLRIEKKTVALSIEAALTELRCTRNAQTSSSVNGRLSKCHVFLT